MKQVISSAKEPHKQKTTLETPLTYPIIPEAVELIKKWEGFKPKRYLCLGKKWTIGYGHVIEKNEKFNEPITEKEAEIVLQKDIKDTHKELKQLCKGVKLNPNQEGALTSLLFNVGGKNFSKSKLLGYLKEGKYLTAGGEFLTFIYADHKPRKGLLNRRKKERLLFLTA